MNFKAISTFSSHFHRILRLMKHLLCYWTKKSWIRCVSMKIRQLGNWERHKKDAENFVDMPHLYTHSWDQESCSQCLSDASRSSSKPKIETQTKIWIDAPNRDILVKLLQPHHLAFPPQVSIENACICRYIWRIFLQEVLIISQSWKINFVVIMVQLIRSHSFYHSIWTQN